MKTNRKDNQNLLLTLTGRGLKYFLLTIFGFAMAFIVFHVCGASTIAETLLSFGVFVSFSRVAILLFCLFSITMIWESWS
ncbi:hypothetical protein [Anabaena sp. PCC 7108]|uniref:hypothetical protein n=1 Tax=Anabaena sp. PCC 7108 TaxID=163908 RepID=UPI00034B6F32|nr:hypothetical protein [Anabaena sp. PCC 7108]